MPPRSFGAYSLLMPIVGGAVDSSQMNEQIILTSASSIWRGIPCAFVRNCVIPPANI